MIRNTSQLGREQVGEGAARVHQVPEGHHEQQGRTARHLRQQGGPHAHRQIVFAQSTQCHAGMSSFSGNSLHLH